MDTETILSILGILLTILFGFIGLRAIKKSYQKQTAKNGSIAIQSGIDSIIGKKNE